MDTLPQHVRRHAPRPTRMDPRLKRAWLRLLIVIVLMLLLTSVLSSQFGDGGEEHPTSVDVEAPAR